MGPRLVSRGKMKKQITFCDLALLQWGRDLLVAESFGLPPQFRDFTELQWGRDLLVAESSVLPLHGGLVRSASMGPRLVSRGKSGVLRGPVRRCGASMGPRLVSRGKSPLVSNAATFSSSFNGAATC